MENEVAVNDRTNLENALKEAEQAVTNTVNVTSTQGNGRVSHFGIAVIIDNNHTGERLFNLRQPLDLENTPRTRLFLGLCQKTCPNPGDTYQFGSNLYGPGLKVTIQLTHRNPDMDIDEAVNLFLIKEENNNILTDTEKKTLESELEVQLQN